MLSSSSSPERICIVRLLAHLAAACLGAEPGQPLHFLATIITAPEVGLSLLLPLIAVLPLMLLALSFNLCIPDSLLFCAQTLDGKYWPTMPDDPLYMAMSALMAAGNVECYVLALPFFPDGRVRAGGGRGGQRCQPLVYVCKRPPLRHRRMWWRDDGVKVPGACSTPDGPPASGA